MRIAVIIPTYNERENIVTLLDGLETSAKRIANHHVSFVVVDDTSPDGTGDIVLDYQKHHKDVFLVTGQKEGLGKALLHGMTYADSKLHADIMVQIDADLSHDPNVSPKFISAIDKGADFVVGSRYIKGGSIPNNWALYRKIYSVIGNAIVRFGLGYPKVHDWTGGYRAYKRRFYQEAKDELVKYRGYVFQIAYLHKSILGGARVTEVPIHFTDRRFGHSKIAPSEYIRDVLWYVASSRIKSILEHPFVKVCVVGGIGFIINTVVLELFVFFGVHPGIGSAVGAEFAIVSNFTLNNAWTFRARKIEGSRRFKKFLQFNTTSLGAIVIQAGTVTVGTLFFGLFTYRYFYILGVGIGLIWNYIMYSRVIWKK